MLEICFLLESECKVTAFPSAKLLLFFCSAKQIGKFFRKKLFARKILRVRLFFWCTFVPSQRILPVGISTQRPFRLPLLVGVPYRPLAGCGPCGRPPLQVNQSAARSALHFAVKGADGHKGRLSTMAILQEQQEPDHPVPVRQERPEQEQPDHPVREPGRHRSPACWQHWCSATAQRSARARSRRSLP